MDSSSQAKVSHHHVMSVDYSTLEMLLLMACTIQCMGIFLPPSPLDARWCMGHSQTLFNDPYEPTSPHLGCFAT
ncbi:hypothetical protein V6N13_061161 [Hibiscus sabdariffa]